MPTPRVFARRTAVVLGGTMSRRFVALVVSGCLCASCSAPVSEEGVEQGLSAGSSSSMPSDRNAYFVSEEGVEQGLSAGSSSSMPSDRNVTSTSIRATP